jgi:hypothetical protein
VIDAEIVAIERALGPVDRWVLFDDDLRGRTGLLEHPTRLAVHVLLQLMEDGAVPASEICTRMAWSDAGEPQRLRQLTAGLWWVQTGVAEDFDPGEAHPVRVRQLRDMDRDPGRGLGRRPNLSPAEREGLARMPILFDTEEALPGIAPHWLMNRELAGRWWRRMGETRCKDWLVVHRSHLLPEDLRHALMIAADETRQGWAFARFMPLKENAAARAWLACDGTDAVVAAVRRDDVARLGMWQVLLRIALPILTARQRGEALVARDDHGQSALARAMALQDGGATVSELVTTIFELRGPAYLQALRVSPPFGEILAGGDSESLGAIGVALAAGRVRPLVRFLYEIERARAQGHLASREVRALLMDADGTTGTLHWDGFVLAMTRNHADAVGVWTRTLVDMARERVLDDTDLIDALTVMRADRSGVYHAAMAAGSAQAAAEYREALFTARKGRQLSRDQIGMLLLGDSRVPHALSLAAAAGHVRCVEEHLAEESAVLGFLRVFDVEGTEHERWYRRGGHAAIGAAMRSGQVEMVRMLGAHAVELQRHDLRRALFPSFAGLPGQVPAIRQAVMAGHYDAASAWMFELASGVEAGCVRRRDMLTLVAAKDDRGVRLFDMAALSVEPAGVARLLAMIAEVASIARLRSSDLVRLLGPSRRRRSPLATALVAGRAESARQIGIGLLRLFGRGALSRRDLRKLLSIRDRSGRSGSDALRAALPPHRSPPEAAMAAYEEIVRQAVRLGLLREREASRWVLAGPPAVGAEAPAQAPDATASAP